jgi:hypothetical protein
MLPLFWIVLLVSPNLNQWRSLWVLFIVHGLLYAGANGYVNSYKKNVPARSDFDVDRYKLFISAGLHVLATVFGFFWVNVTFAILVLFYGLTAHAYGIADMQWETPSIPAWFFVRVVQGGLAVLLYYTGLNGYDFGQVWDIKILTPAIVSTVVLIAFFPVQPNGYAFGSFLDRRVSSVLRILLILAACSITYWFFNMYISPQYNAGIIFFFVVSLVVLFLKSGGISDAVITKQRTLQDWLLAITLNGYAFYLFTDHTHVLQLLQL